jgi:hypothetical protein
MSAALARNYRTAHARGQRRAQPSIRVFYYWAFGGYYIIAPHGFEIGLRVSVARYRRNLISIGY